MLPIALLAVVGFAGAMLLLRDTAGSVALPRSQELRVLMNAETQKAQEVTDKAKTEDRDLTEDEQKSIDAHLAEVDRLKAELDTAVQAEQTSAARTRRLSDAQAFLHASQGRQAQPDALGDRPVTSGVHNRLEDDSARGYRDIAEVAAQVWSVAVAGERPDDRLNILAAASGMSQGESASAGFLVPPQFSQQIVDSMAGDSQNLLQMTDQYPVTGESLTMNGEDETSRADSSRHGGLLPYWIAEAAQLTGTKPKFRQIKLEPHQLGVLCYLTDKIISNAPALQRYLMTKVPQAIVFKVSDAILNGDGKGKPLGILTAGGKVSIGKETGQAAATLVPENIVKMYSAMPARWRSSGAWFYNQECEPQLLLMTLVRGTSAIPVMLPPDGIRSSTFNTIFGRPAIPCEYCQALGTQGDIGFYSMGAYMSGVKGGIQSAISMHLRFDYAETALRWLFGVDGQPIFRSALTPFKGSQTVSPYVVLDARS